LKVGKIFLFLAKETLDAIDLRNRHRRRAHRTPWLRQDHLREARGHSGRVQSGPGNYEAATRTQIPSNPFLTGMSAGLDVGLRRNELLGLCLQAKGWRPQQQA
jgi:hypothetical protein